MEKNIRKLLTGQRWRSSGNLYEIIRPKMVRKKNSMKNSANFKEKLLRLRLHHNFSLQILQNTSEQPFSRAPPVDCF